MKTIIVVIASILCMAAFADTVVPRDSVVKWVNVRQEAVPGSHIPVVGHLHPHESAEFLDEVSSYYEIELQNGVTGFVHKSWTHRIAESASTIKIATFNIQVFGKTKASKTAVMAELASIIRKYDIVAVQEIKNKSGNVPTQFLTEINSDGSAYTLVVSERSGLHPDDQGGQEQYAYYLNTETLHVIEDAGLFDDYTWIVPDDADTNFSTTDACAYDRIVITEDAEEDYADNFGVDTSITSKAVSDHFPVWAEFRTNSDN